jgi:hypothetical protein
MAPERFDGRCDARSDVYSLGLTLYELLARRPAFEARDLEELIHQIIVDGPRGLRSLDRTIPRDLATIVDKAIKRDPKVRYPSADALAGDLRRFLDGQPITARRTSSLELTWRWCKKHPALAAALAALIATSAVIAWQSTRVRAERTIAERHLARLIRTQERFVDFLRLPDLQGAPRSPQLRDALAAALDDFREIERESADNPRIQPSLLLALIRVAYIEHDLGENDKAVASIRSAVARGERYVEQHPSSVEGREALVKTLHWSLVVETDHACATAAQLRADTLIEPLARERPDQASRYRELQLMNNYNFAKRLLDEGRRVQAVALLKAARDLGNAVVRAGARGATTLRALGRVYSYLGEIQGQDGQGDASEASYRRSNDLFHTVYSREPRNLEALMEYCVSREQVQNLLAGRNKLEEATQAAAETCRILEDRNRDEAIEPYERVKILQRLARAQYMLAMQHMENYQANVANAANATRARDELGKAEAACRRVHALAESLRAVAGRDEDLRYFDCMSCTNLYLILNQGDESSPEARQWLARAGERLPENLEKTPDASRRDEYLKIRALIKERPGPASASPSEK